jgi:phenylalanyl-tRNA synthetase beta chain
LKLKHYLPILSDQPKFPVICDSNDTILSWPPIINSEHSKIKLATKNVFIECTATDLTKAHVVLNTLVTMFSQYCTPSFTIEPVKVIYSNGEVIISPKFDDLEMEIKMEYIIQRIGVKLESDQIIKLLQRMGLEGIFLSNKAAFRVKIPPNRSDILHSCDIMEDVAIAYGFNHIIPSIPNTNTIGQFCPLNKLSDILRREMAYAGYTELLTLSLVSLFPTMSFNSILYVFSVHGKRTSVIFLRKISMRL